MTLADYKTFGRRYDFEETCPVGALSSPGVRQMDAFCANYYGRQVNPSDTGNIRGQSSFRILDKLRLTVDPSFQYTLADGGSQLNSVAANDVQRETDGRLRVVWQFRPVEHVTRIFVLNYRVRGVVRHEGDADRFVHPNCADVSAPEERRQFVHHIQDRHVVAGAHVLRSQNLGHFGIGVAGAAPRLCLSAMSHRGGDTRPAGWFATTRFLATEAKRGRDWNIAMLSSVSSARSGTIASLCMGCMGNGGPDVVISEIVFNCESCSPRPGTAGERGWG